MKHLADIDIEADNKDATRSVEEEASASDQIDDQTNLLPARQLILIFSGLSLALFCSLVDQTIVATALPVIGKAFNAADLASWVGTAYLLSSTSVQLVHGRLSDIWGRKPVLLLCLVIFFAGSLACSLAQTMGQLIAFRTLKGLGGGGIVNLVMIIVSDVVDLKRRGTYQGVLGGVVALSNSIGPLLGGALSEKLSWRWCFYINLPISAITIIIIILLLPSRPVGGSPFDKLRKMDSLGMILAPAWVVLLLVPLTLADVRYPWSSVIILAPLCCAIPFFMAFVYVEWRAKLPVMPLRLFRNRTLIGVMITTLLTGVIFYACLFYLPQYFVVVRNVGALEAAIQILPLVLSQTFFGLTSGFMIAKTGSYMNILYIGYASWAIGLGLLCTIGKDTTIAKIAGYQVLAGFGAGQTFQTSLVAVQASVKREDMAVVTSMRNFARLLGGTIALAVCTAIINITLKTNLQGTLSTESWIMAFQNPSTAYLLEETEKDLVIDTYVKAIHTIFYMLTASAIVCLAGTVFLVKQFSLLRDDDDMQRQAAVERLQQVHEVSKT